MSLHSRYDPVREAERYVEATGIPFYPSYIVVSEPGESWLAEVLRKKYPTAFLVALRYDRELFADSDSRWNAVWRPDSSQPPEAFLFNLIPDEQLPLTFFLPWKPSDSMWPDQASAVWGGIASLIRLQKSVMYTRSHFGKKWLSNSVRNLLLVRTAIRPPIVSKPVFLALAGPSLEKQFPLAAGKFFVCGVSSSISFLADRKCPVDLCIATDGGYWALDLFRNLDRNVPLAFPLEAAVPSGVLERNPAVLLDYGSETEKALFSIAGIAPEKAKRNGTVAGTAALYLLERTGFPVYAAGLDLQNTRSFSHARPHPSMATYENSVNRLDPLSGELFCRNRDSASLAAYASWFSSRGASFRERFFRLAPAGIPLDGIRTKKLSDVATGIDKTGPAETDARKIEIQPMRDAGGRKSGIIDFIDRFTAEAEACLAIADSGKKSDFFAVAMLAKGINSELLQMISYTGYINALKQSRIAGHEAACSESVDGLCREAVSFFSGLKEKVRAYGK